MNLSPWKPRFANEIYVFACQIDFNKKALYVANKTKYSSNFYRSSGDRRYHQSLLWMRKTVLLWVKTKYSLIQRIFKFYSTKIVGMAKPYKAKFELNDLHNLN